MATQRSIQVLDDIDGGVITPDKSITFGLEGKEYEIDLSPENAAKLRSALQPFIEVARIVPRQRLMGAPHRRGGGRSKTTRPD